MIDVTVRTVVRGFLVVGGLVFVVNGAIQGSTFDLGLGVAAVLLGGIGLWMEWRESVGDDSMDNV